MRKRWLTLAALAVATVLLALSHRCDLMVAVAQGKGPASEVQRGAVDFLESVIRQYDDRVVRRCILEHSSDQFIDVLKDSERLRREWSVVVRFLIQVDKMDQHEIRPLRFQQVSNGQGPGAIVHPLLME